MDVPLARGRRRRLARPTSDSWPRTARRLNGPLYAAVGAGPAFQGGFGQSGSGRHMTVSAAVCHVRPGAELDVDTTDERPWGDSAFNEWRLVSDWLHRAVRPDRIDWPLTLTADRWEGDVPIDGLPVRFLFVGDATTWSATGEVDGRQVTVAGNGWPHHGLALAAIALGDVSGNVPVRT